jgi:hypothetical protein
MPHFFFQVLDDVFPRVRVGVSLATLQDAYVYAINHAGACVAARPDLLRDGEAIHVEVADVEGQPLFVVTTYAMETVNTVLA